MVCCTTSTQLSPPIPPRGGGEFQSVIFPGHHSVLCLGRKETYSPRLASALVCRLRMPRQVENVRIVVSLHPKNWTETIEFHRTVQQLEEVKDIRRD